MNKTKKGLFTLVSILAVCITVSVLAQPTPFVISGLISYSDDTPVLTPKVTITNLNTSEVFDTGPSPFPYPSIMGVHNGTILPSTNILVDKIYTYPCRGTGGHIEHIKIWIDNTFWNVTATWEGYVGDWHNISFNELFMLEANIAYNYTIKTGSYPQIIHAPEYNATGGKITCSEFIDANGKKYNNWIPAIKLEQNTLPNGLGYLADDMISLPEIQDGISQEEIEAAELIANLLSSPDPEVQQGLQVIEEYGVPPEEEGHWIDFETPKYNTQLEVLFWLAEANRIDEDYEQVALALALDYGSVVTIGDDQVDRRVKNYVVDMYDYIRETDEILEDKKLPWEAANYPLEADIGLVWGAMAIYYPNPPGYGFKYVDGVWIPTGKSMFWYDEFQDRQMNSEDFDWLFVNKSTLEEMRDWMFRNGFADLSDKPIECSNFTIGELITIFNRTVTRLSANEYYNDKEDTVAGCIATYIYGWGQDKEEHFIYPIEPHKPPDFPSTPNITIDGRTVETAQIANPDWMWEYFKENNFFIGHCVDDSFVEGMLLKSINIPSVIGCMKHHAVPLYYNPNDAVLRTGQCSIVEDGTIYYRVQKVPYDNLHGDIHFLFAIESSDGMLFLKGISIENILSQEK